MSHTQACSATSTDPITVPPQSATQPREAADPPRSRLATESAARRIIDALATRGVTTYFGIPGGPVCPLFEAIRLTKGVRLIESRHEAHAAFSAASYQRATGRVPALVVTAGPGITNSVTGIASAHLERVPILILCGDVAWDTHGGRLAQDCGPEGLAIPQLLSSITRAQVRVVHPRAAVSQAISVWNAATQALNPGPALLIVPLDRATAEAPAVEIEPATESHRLRSSAQAITQTAHWLAEAERPLLVLGGACRKHGPAIRRLVDLLSVPFVTTPRAKGIVSEHHPLSLRNAGMAASLWARRYTARGVDVTLALGTDLDDTSMGPTPYVGTDGRLIHVDFDASVFNRNLPTALSVHADLCSFTDDLCDFVQRTDLRSSKGVALMQQIHAESPFDVPDFDREQGEPIAPSRAIADLERAAGNSARFISDIGEHMLFALHYLTAEGPESFHIQLNLGSMGSGIAGAIGLALADTTRPVVCVCGDGGMHMTGMEVLTAVKERLPIVYAVFNDGRYNMVHHGMKQIFSEAELYDSAPVDFEQWAQSLGIPAITVTRAGQIDAALLEAMLSEGGPALLDIRIDKERRVAGGGRVEALQHMSMLAQAASKVP